jgi:hypothetical protein
MTVEQFIADAPAVTDFSGIDSGGTGSTFSATPGATSARAVAGNRTPLIAQSDCRGLFRSAVCRAVRPSNPEPTLGSAIGPTEAGPGAFGLPVTSPKIHHLMRSVKGPCTQSRWFRRVPFQINSLPVGCMPGTCGPGRWPQCHRRVGRNRRGLAGRSAMSATANTRRPIFNSGPVGEPGPAAPPPARCLPRSRPPWHAHVGSAFGAGGRPRPRTPHDGS